MTTFFRPPDAVPAREERAAQAGPRAAHLIVASSGSAPSALEMVPEILFFAMFLQPSARHEQTWGMAFIRAHGREEAFHRQHEPKAARNAMQ